jgi:hypothetical protein
MGLLSMKSLLGAGLSLVGALCFAAPVAAQSEQEFINAFSGEWYVFDADMHTRSAACLMALLGTKKDGVLPVGVDGCEAPLSTVDRWSIRDGRIILSSQTAEIAAMGGNQFRVTGELNDTGKSLVIERGQGDGNSAKIAAALRKHKCYFVGFSQRCAVEADLKIPEISEGESFATIETLANINARAQPRRDAPSLGVIALGIRVQVDQCLTASDGPWCRAKIGDNVVWLAMTALRQNEWPIVTYRTVASP